LAELNRDIESGKYGYVDRMVVVRNGYVVVNARYENDYQEISRGHKGPLGCGVDACEDPSELHQYNYYHPDWHPYYQGRDVHTLQSATKSVASTLIGIAIGTGEIDGTNANLLSFFEGYDLSRVDDRLLQATLDDLLTMRSGIEWHEVDRPFDETNTTLQLEASDDWIQFTLDQPMDADPGEKWVYNSGGSHMMSGIIRKATGQYTDEYAEKHLFGPLGIRDYHWKKTPKGFPDTEGGLYLEAEQFAKIGFLYLNDGVWDGRRILPEGWVDASTMHHVEQVNNYGWGYGYQWWRLDKDETDVWAALGFGTQALLIIPQHHLVGVVNCWNIFEGEYPNVRDEFLSVLLASAMPSEN
jgi:CubicO group peptidase (beta-lactamase class C family)